MKTKKLIIILVMVLFSLLAVGCSNKENKENEKENKELITKEFDLKDFNSFDVSTAIDMNVTKGAEYKVEVIAPSDVFEHLVLKVDNETLVAKIEGKVESSKNQKVVVNVTTLSAKKLKVQSSARLNLLSSFENKNDVKIDVATSGSLKGKISGKKLELNVDSSGSVRLEGLFANVDVKTTDSASADLTGMKIENATVNISKASSVIIGVTGKIELTASSAASITVLSGNLVKKSTDVSVSITVK